MMGVLIPSVMALRGTHETAPLDQQGEPLPSSALVPRAPSPKGRLWVTDCHTSVATLVRNDMRDAMILGRTGGLPHQCEHWFAMTCGIR